MMHIDRNTKESAKQKKIKRNIDVFINHIQKLKREGITNIPLRLRDIKTLNLSEYRGFKLIPIQQQPVSGKEV